MSYVYKGIVFNNEHGGFDDANRERYVQFALANARYLNMFRKGEVAECVVRGCDKTPLKDAFNSYFYLRFPDATDGSGCHVGLCNAHEGAIYSNPRWMLDSYDINKFLHRVVSKSLSRSGRVPSARCFL